MLPTGNINQKQVADEIYKKFKDRESKAGTVLCLVGVHGTTDGAVKNDERETLKDWKYLIPLLEVAEGETQLEYFLTEKGLELKMIDIGEYSAPHCTFTKELDEVIKRIMNEDKNKEIFLAIAFCYTNKSILNHFLRATGIYSHLMISSERANITRGNCLALDLEQKEVLENVAIYHDYLDYVEAHSESATRVAEYQERYGYRKVSKNLLLAGSSGTGKTILLAEAMTMRIAHYMRKGVPLRIIIAVWSEQAQELSKGLMDKYFPHLKEDSFIGNFKDFCSKFNIFDDDGNIMFSKMPNEVKDALRQSGKFVYLNDLNQNIMVEGKETSIREFINNNSEFDNITTVEILQNYKSLEEKFNVDLSSLATTKQTNNLVSAISCAASENRKKPKKTLLFIDEFKLQVEEKLQDFSSMTAKNENVDFFIGVSPWSEGAFEVKLPHKKSQIFGKQLKNRYRNSLEIMHLNTHFIGKNGVNNTEDMFDEKGLPKGKLPLLIVKKEEDSHTDILTYIEEYENGEYIKGQGVTVLGRVSDEIDAWCMRDKENRKNIAEYTFAGCEDDVIIIFCNAFEEEVTRARTALIIVTEPGGSR